MQKQLLIAASKFLLGEPLPSSNSQARIPTRAATKTMPAAIITAPFILTVIGNHSKGALKVDFKFC